MERTFKELYSKALKLLTGRNYFAEELKAALLKKYAAPGDDAADSADTGQTADLVIEQLIKDRYLDDARSLKSYVRWKVDSGYGPYYIREKLRQKGVNCPVQEINRLIDEEGINVSERIDSLVKKYRKTKKKQTSGAFKRSCLNYLTGRGFAVSDSLKILKYEATEDESDFFEGC